MKKLMILLFLIVPRLWSQAQSGLGAPPTILIRPSGDATGGTDCGNIQSKCSGGASLQLAVGTYYFGKSNTTCTLTNVCIITGQGPGSTIIQNEGSTNDTIDITTANGTIVGPPYQNPFPSGGRIAGIRIQQDALVVPSAGAGLRIGTGVSGGVVTQSYLISNVDIAGTYRLLQIDPGVWDNHFEHMRLTNPISTNSVYYDAPAPSGDNHFTQIFLEAPGSGGHPWGDWFINRADSSTDFSGIKVNDGSFVFGNAGSSNLVFTGIGVENGGEKNCAFDFSAGSTSVYGTYAISGGEFETGNVGNHTDPFPICGAANTPLLAVTNFCVGGSFGSATKCFSTPVAQGQAYDNFWTPTTGVDLAIAETNTVQPWIRTFTGTWATAITSVGANAMATSGGGAGPGAYYLSMTPRNAAYTVQASITLGVSGGGWGMVGDRLNSPASSTIAGYGCIFQQAVGVQLLQWHGNGLNSQIGSTDTTFTSGTHMIGITSTLGNVHTCLIDGKASATATGSDSTYTAAGFPWIATYQSGGSGYFISQPFTVQ